MSADNLRFAVTLDATQFESSMNGVVKKINEAGNEAEKAEPKLKKLSGADFSRMAGSMVALGTSTFSTYKAFDDLNDMQIRVRQSSLQVSKAQEEVNKLQREGKTGTLDYQQAIERLGIAQDRQQKIQDDVNQAQIQFALNLTTMAVGTIPMGIKSIMDLTKGVGGLKAVFAMLEVGMGKWLLIATAVILAFEGIAHLIKYFSGGDIDITIENLGSKLTGALTGSSQSAKELNSELPEIQNNLGNVGKSASDAGTSFADLNKQMDHTVSILKKNEIKSGLDGIKTDIAESLIMFGSLESISNTLQEAGVIDLMDKVAKDTRTIQRELGSPNPTTSRYTIVYDPNGNPHAVLNDEQHLGKNISAPQNDGFIQIGSMKLPVGTTAYSDFQKGKSLSYSREASKTTVLGGHSALLQAKYLLKGGTNITGANFLNITGGMKTLTTRSSTNTASIASKLGSTNAYKSTLSNSMQRAVNTGGLTRAKGRRHGSAHAPSFVDLLKPANEARAQQEAQIRELANNLGIDMQDININSQFAIPFIYAHPRDYAESVSAGRWNPTNEYNAFLQKFNEQIANTQGQIESRKNLVISMIQNYESLYGANAVDEKAIIQLGVSGQLKLSDVYINSVIRDQVLSQARSDYFVNQGLDVSGYDFTDAETFRDFQNMLAFQNKTQYMTTGTVL